MERERGGLRSVVRRSACIPWLSSCVLSFLLLTAAGELLAQEEYIPGCEGGTRRFYWGLDPENATAGHVDLKAAAWFGPDGHMDFHASAQPLPSSGRISTLYSVFRYNQDHYPLYVDGELVPKLESLWVTGELPAPPCEEPEGVPDPDDVSASILWGHTSTDYVTTDFEWSADAGRWAVYCNIDGVGGSGSGTLPYIETWNWWFPIDGADGYPPDDPPVPDPISESPADITPILHGGDTSQWCFLGDGGQYGYPATWQLARVQVEAFGRTFQASFDTESYPQDEETTYAIETDDENRINSLSMSVNG